MREHEDDLLISRLARVVVMLGFGASLLLTVALVAAAIVGLIGLVRWAW